MAYRIKITALLIGILGAQGAWAADTLMVSAAVSLPTKSLKADQQITVPVWLSNGSAEIIKSVDVELAGASSVHLLSRNACEDQAAISKGWQGILEAAGLKRSSLTDCKEGPKTSLGMIAPNRDLKANLCLCLTKEVQEGDYKLLFIFQPSSSTGSTSAVAVEKEVEIGLFGPQSVGGLSLRLMSLFVPGFIFLWLFPLFWGSTITSGIERGVGAVLISAFLLASSYVVSHPGIPGAISVQRLVTLVLVAAFLAISTGSGLRLLSRCVLAQPTDSLPKSMKKLLRLRRANYLLKSLGLAYEVTVDNPRVWLASEKVVCGCIMGRVQTGWMILPDLRLEILDGKVRTVFQSKDGKWIDLLRHAERKEHKETVRVVPGYLYWRDKRGAAFEPGEVPRILISTKDILSWESRKETEWGPIAID